MLNIWQHQKQQPQIKVAIKNMSLTCRPSCCRLDSSYCWSKKKLGLGTISHTISTIFSFLQTGTHYFAKWGEVTSWILKSAERLSVLCFACEILQVLHSNAPQSSAQLCMSQVWSWEHNGREVSILDRLNVSHQDLRILNVMTKRTLCCFCKNNYVLHFRAWVSAGAIGA